MGNQEAVNTINQALESGDYSQAIKVAATAIWDDTLNNELIATASSVLQQSGKALELTDPNQPDFTWSQVAMTSLAHSLEHDFNSATKWLLELSTNYSQPYLVWAKKWIEHPSFFLDFVNMDKEMSQKISNFINGLDHTITEDHADYQNADALACILGKTYDTVTPKPRGVILYYGQILRKLNRWETALAVAADTKAISEEMSYLMESWVWRDKNEPEQYIAALEKARQVNPENYSIALDIANYHLQVGNIVEAKSNLLSVPMFADEYYYAQPRQHYCNYLLTGNQNAVNELITLAKSGNDVAKDLLTKVDGLDPSVLEAIENAQEEASTADEDPNDPIIFPGQPIECLSQYVALMKKMQSGDMEGALAEFGLDMGAYGAVAAAWAAKMTQDTSLAVKYGQMMM